jgi:N-acetylglucosamine-6-phosphate deacetylase
MRCILRVKTPARLILTCDASPLAGSPPGKYRPWDQEFEILPNGKIVVSGTPYLAGSWAFTDLCIGNVLKLGETSLADTIDMASNRPRELLGLPPRRIEVGEPAELILCDWGPGHEFMFFTWLGHWLGRYSARNGHGCRCRDSAFCCLLGSARHVCFPGSLGRRKA